MVKTKKKHDLFLTFFWCGNSMTACTCKRTLRSSRNDLGHNSNATVKNSTSNCSTRLSTSLQIFSPQPLDPEVLAQKCGRCGDGARQQGDPRFFFANEDPFGTVPGEQPKFRVQKRRNQGCAPRSLHPPCSACSISNNATTQPSHRPLGQARPGREGHMLFAPTSLSVTTQNGEHPSSLYRESPRSSRDCLCS